MRLVTHVIEHASKTDFWWIKTLGDIHLGSINCDEELLDEDIAWIAENGAFWIGTGDYAEFISRKDVRYRPDEVAEWCRNEPDISETQIQRFLKKIDSIKEQCIGLLKGNHEDQIYDRYDNDVYGRILAYVRLGDKQIRLDTRGFIRLIFQRVVDGRRQGSRDVDIFTEHGYGGGRMEGAPALALGRLSKNYDADIYMEGHRHIEMSFPDERVRIAGKRLIKERILFVATGTYLLGWREDTEIYGDRKQYPPKPTGTPLIKVTPWSSRKRFELTF